MSAGTPRASAEDSGTPVPFIDLVAQYATIRDEVRTAVDRCFESQTFILGDEVLQLEKEIAAYCGAKHAIGCASGTDALILALLAAGRITQAQAFERASAPFKTFMLRNVREKDLKLFLDLAKVPAPKGPEDVGLEIVTPAFMISELRRAFEIGFLLFIPFLIIDLVVASVLMAVGMMMVPPATVALPFKLIFFVLVDGWTLVAGSLVQSYGG
mgnify:CR=1 FL=1